MSYSDSHIHIVDYPEKSIADFTPLMKSAGISMVVGVAVNLDVSEASLALADRFDWVVPSIGIHPWFAEPLTAADKQRFETMAASGRAKALGEIGLDYSPADEPPPGPPPGTPVLEGIRMPKLPAAHPSHEVQRDVFAYEIGLAVRYDLPINVHFRGGAEIDMIELLKRPEHEGIRGIAHGFAGDLARMQQWLDIGFLVALGYHEVIVEPREHMTEVVRALPLDRLVLETDANPMVNTEGPLAVLQLAQEVALIRGTDAGTIGSAATENLNRLLKTR